MIAFRYDEVAESPSMSVAMIWLGWEFTVERDLLSFPRTRVLIVTQYINRYW